MLILCSNGLTSEKLLASVSERAIDCKMAVLVVTADNEYKEKNYHVQRCVEELKSLNLTVDIFDIDSQPVELLLNYDIVEFIGGNPFYLLHYDRFKRKFERFEERCHAYEEKRNVKVIRINDGDGIFIDGEEISVCHI